MLSPTKQTEKTTLSEKGSFDVIIVGAGFAGIYMLHRLRDSGLSVKLIDASESVGGTWSWNRYPGARTDNEAWYYCYSFSGALSDEWDWTERYPAQSEVQRYFEYVVDKFDLRSKIQLETTITSAIYDESRSKWRLESGAGESFSCRYFIAATGLLSAPYRPTLPGLDEFRGEVYSGWNWPERGVEYAGKRIGIIGTGSTATQMVPVLAETAQRLYVFQRTPQFVIEGGNRAIEAEQLRHLKDTYGEIWSRVKQFPTMMDFEFTGRLAKETSPEERLKIFEEGWQVGGLRFLFETFDDVMGDLESNSYAADFLRSKISEIVVDPKTAGLLTPRGYPLGAKRPVVGHRFYEAFNRDNVTLVDISTHGVEGFTPWGIKAGGGMYQLDIAVIATGFDAYTGALTRMDVRGRSGRTLADKWRDGVTTYLGLAYAGFPNMFSINGPHSPVANLPTVAECQGDWIADAISWMEGNEVAWIEPEFPAESKWVEETKEVGKLSMLPHGEHVRSWFYGANIPGKTHEVLVYAGHQLDYFTKCRSVAEEGYRGFAKGLATDSHAPVS